MFILSGCASLKTEPDFISPLVVAPRVENGVYHKVLPQQTLWRISKAYSVPLDEIIRANNIPNAAKVERNQLIFIPGAEKVKEIIIESSEEQKEFIWPVEGKIIKYFKDRRGAKISKGIDIQVQSGDKVKAARTGRIVFADYLGGYNETVIIDHEDGYYSVYAQGSKILVKLGDYIFKNTPIAIIEKNGNKLAYLHFEIRKQSMEDNPLYYLPQ